MTPLTDEELEAVLTESKRVRPRHSPETVRRLIAQARRNRWVAELATSYLDCASEFLDCKKHPITTRIGDELRAALKETADAN